MFGYDFNESEMKEYDFISKSFGRIDCKKALLEVYQSSDVFIFPSILESFGQTLYESMSCGLIPISYDVGFANEVIDDQYNGYIIANFDKEKLVDSFINLMSKNISDMKKNVRKSILKEFSKDIILEKHLSLIKNLRNA